MKVIFYCNADNSDEFEFPDDVSDEKLSDAACDWVADNVIGYYDVVEMRESS